MQVTEGVHIHYNMHIHSHYHMLMHINYSHTCLLIEYSLPVCGLQMERGKHSL